MPIECAFFIRFGFKGVFEHLRVVPLPVRLQYTAPLRRLPGPDRVATLRAVQQPHPASGRAGAMRALVQLTHVKPPLWVVRLDAMFLCTSATTTGRTGAIQNSIWYCNHFYAFVILAGDFV